MRSLHLLSRWGARSTLSMPSALRVEVRPPSLRHAPASRWQRIVCWLMAPAPQDTSPPLNRLPGVRAEFLDCLNDVHTEDAANLCVRVGHARSLRELWHLRTEVYRLVAVQHSQFEAEQRLTRLNRHFPTRAPRPGYVSFSS